MSNIETYPSMKNLVSDIVSSYLSNNQVPPEVVPTLIREIYNSLEQVAQGNTGSIKDNRPEPSVDPKSSVFRDYIICLEDGKHLKTLKRHLKTEHNLTPDEYRERWDLPPEYPMVSPNYTERRSQLARQNKLGQK